MARITRLQAGFTVIEIMVVIVIFSVSIIAVGAFAAVIQGAQRNDQYLEIANSAARDQIEQLRNSNYSLLVAGQTINLTPNLPDSLPPNKSGTAVISDPSIPNLKRIDVTINYSVGSYPHTVKLTALIGASGLTR